MKLAFLATVVATVVNAANSIIPGPVLLNPTFECIGIRANYTGDDNANATVAVSYRVTGATAWKDSYTPFIDRRSTVGGFSNAANNRQGRVSIVGLAPATLYNVRVAWSDPDGGSGATTNNVATLRYTVPTSGVVKTVSGGGNAIVNFLSTANPGDTGLVENGTYLPFTWTKSGIRDNWIVLKAAPGHKPVIGGGSVRQNINLQASFVVIDGFGFATTQLKGIETSAAAHDVFIQNCRFDGVGGNSGFTTAIELTQRTNIYVLTNFIANVASTAEDVHALQFGSSGAADTIVIKGNTIIGSSWDGIGGGGNYPPDNGPARNVDIYRNTIRNCRDDGIELEGSGVNVRCWGNTISTDRLSDGSAIGVAPIHIGPTYVFRNTASSTNHAGVKGGNNSSGPIYFFHNVFSTVGSTSSGWEATGEAGGAPYSNLSTFINNILEARGNTIYLSGPQDTFNFNCHRSTTGQLVYRWNGGSISYGTIGQFRSATGQEAGGIEGNALVTSYTTGMISSNSPCINKGVVLANFNSLDSAWPYNGSAPDIGAVEVGGSPAPPVDPPEIFLQWAVPTLGPVDSYRVYSSIGMSEFQVVTNTVGTSAKVVVDTNVVTRYRVRALNTQGEGPPSNTFTNFPGTVTNTVPSAPRELSGIVVP